MDKLAGIDIEALELSKKLMDVIGRMIMWRGMLPPEAENLYVSLREYKKYLEGKEK